MSAIRCTVGAYAKTPYRIGEAGVNVYCLEELCYYLVQNVSFLEKEDMNQDLIDWIDASLGLSELARNLQQIARGVNTFALFVSTIIEYAQYATREELVTIREILNENSKLNPFERKKKKIDHKAAKGDVAGALHEYQALLSALGNRDVMLSAAVFAAMGKAANALFLYEYAEGLFEQAYRLTFQKEYLLLYLCTVKLHGNPAQQRQKILAIGNFPDLEAEAEACIQQVKAAYETSERKQAVDAFLSLPKGSEYYQTLSALSEQMKDAYRSKGE